MAITSVEDYHMAYGGVEGRAVILRNLSHKLVDHYAFSTAHNCVFNVLHQTS